MHRTTSTIDVARAPARAPTRESGIAGRQFAIRRVLVVCLGNVCRSPIAEYLLRERLGKPEVTVESAGIAAADGARIDPRALAVLERHGIDGDLHVARRLQPGMVDAADLVLVMERDQLDYMRTVMPSSTGKTFLLGKWQGDFEIPDPYGKPKESFDHVYRMVDLAVRRWCALI